MRNTRDYYFDNTKGLLMFLVILTHIIEPVIEYKFKLKSAYIITYTFHMPLFIFLSGYFSRKSSRTVKQRVKKMFLLFIGVQFLYSLFYIYVMKNSNSQMTFVYPNWTLWYLQALIVWYILSDYFNGFYKWMFGSIIVALLIGFDENVYTFLSISRILVFLPFFVAGYFFDRKYINIIKKNRIVLTIIGFIIGGFIYNYNNRIDVQWLYGFEPYKQIDTNMMIGLIIRFCTMIISTIFSMIVLAWVPSRKNILSFTGKYTLVLYLVHSIVIQCFLKLGLYKHDSNVQLATTVILILITVYSILGLFIILKNIRLKNTQVQL